MYSTPWSWHHWRISQQSMFQARSISRSPGREVLAQHRAQVLRRDPLADEAHALGRSRACSASRAVLEVQDRDVLQRHADVLQEDRQRALGHGAVAHEQYLLLERHHLANPTPSPRGNKDDRHYSSRDARFPQPARMRGAPWRGCQPVALRGADCHSARRASFQLALDELKTRPTSVAAGCQPAELRRAPGVSPAITLSQNTQPSPGCRPGLARTGARRRRYFSRAGRNAGSSRSRR